jgi:hypothetical protein
MPTLIATRRGARKPPLTINATESVQVFERMARGPASLLLRHAAAVSRPQTRPRGAGRPRAAATRSSANSGDSGDDSPGEPAGPAVSTHWTPAADPAGTKAARLGRLIFDATLGESAS